MHSNIPGCTAVILLKDALVIGKSQSRTLICIPELDRLGYECLFSQGNLTISLKGKKIFVLPRLPESNGKLVDAEDRMKSRDIKPFCSESVHLLYPIPDSCFKTSPPLNGKADILKN